MEDLMIYHYCNRFVFEKILETKEIWLSDITKMNDESEYRSGYEIIREVLSDFGLRDHVIVNEMSDKNLNQTFQILIGCFSRNGNLHNQWFEYAERGTGVSIGFDAEKIKQFNLFNRFTENSFEPISSTVNFINVNYDEKLLRNSAQAIIKKYINSQSPITWTLLSRELMYLAISYKDNFFSKENETRAIVTLESIIDDKYKIEQRENKYGEVNFHRLRTSYQQLQSIVEIIIGPKSIMSIEEVKSMLINAGIKDAVVRHSIVTE